MFKHTVMNHQSLDGTFLHAQTLYDTSTKQRTIAWASADLISGFNFTNMLRAALYQIRYIIRILK
jgi:hypothetical protein